MNRAVASRFLALRRFVQKRNGSDHHVANPGPPCTFDLMAVPHQSYQKVHGELNSKFNAYLVVSAIFFVSSFATALYTNTFVFEEAIRPPQSYRNRH